MTSLQIAALALVLAAVYATVVLAARFRELSTRDRIDAEGETEAAAVEREDESEPELESAAADIRPAADARRTSTEPRSATTEGSRPRLPAAVGPPRVTASVPRSSSASCEIRWWRGYVTSTFYAAAGGPEAERVIGESPSFRWRRSEPPPREPAATAALETLVRSLEEDGWRVVDRGDEWYSLRLRRRAGAPEPRAPHTDEPERPL